jgi:putative membrane protein
MMAEYWWIFPIVMIILCFFMMRGCMGGMSSGKGRRSSSTGSALEILDRRYAKGEIGKREFEEKKRDLDQSDS